MIVARIFILASLIALTVQGASLTDAEKQLLRSSISAAAATEYGENADAAGLARIIEHEDLSLVQAFDAGMSRERTTALPAEVEALVITHFDHPKLGAALRAMRPKYRSRRLFDLQYARIKAATSRDDPSFSQILNTDLAGIEKPLLQLLDKFAAKPDRPNRLVLWLGYRKDPGAIPLLLESLKKSYSPVVPQNSHLAPPELRLLVQYPSVEVWRKARYALEDLHRSGTMTDATFQRDVKMLDRQLKDPEKSLAHIRQQARLLEYNGKQYALRPTERQIRKQLDVDPKRYVSEYRAYLEKLEKLLAEYSDSVDDYPVGVQYFELGTLVRFKLRRPAEAAALYEKSARNGHGLGQIAAADTYQFDLREKASAAKAYQRALDSLRQPTAPKVFNPYRPDTTTLNTWLDAWLPHEVRYLNSGQGYRGSVQEPAIGGLFDTIFTYSGSIRRGIAPELPTLTFRRGPGAPGFSQMSSGSRPHEQTDRALAKVDREQLAKRLDDLPASRLSLLATIEQLSVLTDAGQILRYLERHDPSGYWSDCLLRGVILAGQKSARETHVAQRLAIEQALPGLVASNPGDPRAISVAAEQFMRARKSAPETLP